MSIPRLPTYVYWVLPAILVLETTAKLFLLMSGGSVFPPIWFIVLVVIGSVVVGIPVLIAFCKVWYRWAARTFEKPLSLEAFFGPNAFFGFFIETLLIFKLDSGLSTRHPWFKYCYYGSFILSFAAIPVGFMLYVLLMFR